MTGGKENVTSGPSCQPTQGRLLVSVAEIEAFDATVWEITRGLPIRTGSLLKVPSAFYGRFGIGLTSDNRERLKTMSEYYYVSDIEERLELERLRRDAGAFDTAWKRDTENKMSWAVAAIIREMMQALDDGVRRFRICDIDCERGETASAIAGELYRHSESRNLLSRVEFHLVDWSPSSLLNARALLNQMYGTEVYKHEFMDFEDFLRGSKEKTYDFVVSVASFDRKSFPDYLTQVNRVLADDGALVSGDWHSAFWHHPFNLYRLLEAMGADDRRLGALTSIFGAFLNQTPGWNAFPEESQAIKDHFDYWLKVHSEVKALGTLGRPKLYMLRAGQTSREHAENLESAGFTTNPDDIRKAFREAPLPDLPRRVLSGSDFAVVTAAIKKR